MGKTGQGWRRPVKGGDRHFVGGGVYECHRCVHVVGSTMTHRSANGGVGSNRKMQAEHSRAETCGPRNVLHQSFLVGRLVVNLFVWALETEQWRET